MDLLRNELEAAYQRIAELEKELDTYRSPSASADSLSQKVVTRASAAAAAAARTPRSKPTAGVRIEPKPTDAFTIAVPPASPTTSTNATKKSRIGRRAMSSGGIGKRKERGGLVAKCTEPRAGQTRYWTEDEHERFLEAVAQYGEKAYVAISNYVETRTPKQVRTHAQKFQMKMARLAKEKCEAGERMELPPGMLPISIGIDPSQVVSTPPANMLTGRAPPPPTSVATEATDAASSDASGTTQVADMLAEAVSPVSEDLTDPYLNYIGGETEGDGVVGLEDCFAAKLRDKQSMTTARTQDDDLEDLEDCGEMASLSNFDIIA